LLFLEETITLNSNMRGENVIVDRVIAERGPKHIGLLRDIADTLKNKVLSKEFIDEIYSPESQKRIDVFAQRQQYFDQILNTFFDAYKSSESSRARGHEKSHILEVMNSAHRIFEEYEKSGKPLTEVEKFEAILGCMGHDLGRYVEPFFPDLNKKSLEIFMPFIDAREIAGQLGMPEELGNRILYDIGSASPEKTGHIIADLVHQCDREQLGGPIMISRLMTYIGAGDFIFPQVSVLRPFTTKLPRITEEFPLESLFRMEIWMRNVYPPTSPEGDIAKNQVIQQTAVILMLGLLGMDEKYKLVFAPELGLVESKDLEKTKKPLPPRLFKAAEKEFEQFLKNVNLDGYNPEESLELAKLLMASNKIMISEDFDKVFMDRIAKSDFLVSRNRWLITKYSFEARHRKRLKDLTRLKKTQNGVSGTVAEWLKQELKSQEAITAEFYREH